MAAAFFFLWLFAGILVFWANRHRFRQERLGDKVNFLFVFLLPVWAVVLINAATLDDD